jgi:hypothetical protein
MIILKRYYPRTDTFKKKSDNTKIQNFIKSTASIKRPKIASFVLFDFEKQG